MNASRMMIFFCAAISIGLALLPHALWLLGWVGCKIAGVRLPYRYFGLTALALVVIFLGTMAYGYYIGRWKVHSTHMEYAHKDIPKAFDGFKIVHISDLHLGTFEDAPERFMKFIDEINSHDPDLVCFTGDMVTLGKSEADPFTESLKKIKSRHGVLSVLGNHDFLIYGFDRNLDRKAAIEELTRYQREELGWTLLRNQNTVIESVDSSKITFIGVDNSSFTEQGFKSVNLGNLWKAKEGTDGFRILLSHDPSHWSGEVVPHSDIPLTLSGHTHCAQVRIFGWTPATVSFKETAGRYDRDGKTLYINIGLGCTAPFRIGANPEVTEITLRSAL